jgi:hypothetical protein
MSRSDYGAFLNNDGYFSFSDYLGIELPEVESRRKEGRYQYRYIRQATSYHPCERFQVEIAGEWHDTKKAAKASYKLALQKSRRAV